MEDPLLERDINRDFYSPDVSAGVDQIGKDFSAAAQRKEFLGGGQEGKAQPSGTEQRKAFETWFQALSGNGLEVARREGWAKYRSMLEGMTWEPMARLQLQEVAKLREQAKTEPPTYVDNPMRTRQHIREYVEAIVAKYPTDGNAPFAAFTERTHDGKLGNKLELVGKKCPLLGQEKMTRVYMALDEVGLRSGFEALRQELEANGALEKIDLALNLETIHEMDYDKADNNSVIMYVSDSDPEILTKVTDAIALAKQKQPTFFKLSSEQLARAKESSTKSFMVPLDDTTWFVEVEKEKGARSYHQGIFTDMKLALYRGNKPSIDAYIETLASRRPEIRDKTPIMNNGKALPRRLAMPGLVVQNVGLVPNPST